MPTDDLLSPPSYLSPKKRRTGLLLWPVSNHPHTSKVDADSDMASSMRVSVLSHSVFNTRPSIRDPLTSPILKRLYQRPLLSLTSKAPKPSPLQARLRLKWSLMMYPPRRRKTSQLFLYLQMLISRVNLINIYGYDRQLPSHACIPFIAFSIYRSLD